MSVPATYSSAPEAIDTRTGHWSVAEVRAVRSEGVITDTWTLWLTETRPVCLTGSSEQNFCSENVNVSRVYSSITVEASLIKLEQRSVAS